MMTLEEIQNRRDKLSNYLSTSEVDLEIAKDRVKCIKKEIANTKGAIIELNNIIEECY